MLSLKNNSIIFVYGLQSSKIGELFVYISCIEASFYLIWMSKAIGRPELKSPHKVKKVFSERWDIQKFKTTGRLFCILI